MDIKSALSNPFVIKLVEHLHQYTRALNFLAAEIANLKDDQRFRTYVLAALVLLLGFLCSFLLRSPEHHSQRAFQARKRKALESLLTVLAPHRSRWPASYIAISSRAARSNPRSMSGSRSRSRSRTSAINLPLSLLVEDLLAGTVELRDSNALQEIISGNRIYGWRFRLSIGLGLRVRVLWNALKCKYRWPGIPHIELLRERLTQNPVTNAAPAIHILRLSALPVKHFAPLIRTALHAIPPGKMLTIEFTALAHGISVLSADYMICAVPSLLLPPPSHTHKHRHHHKQKHDPFWPAPMRTTLARILRLLSGSGARPLVVDAIHNVSERRVQQLDAELALLDTRVGRLAVTEGVAEWRRRKLVKQWEAGVLGAGMMEVWAVVVHRP